MVVAGFGFYFLFSFFIFNFPFLYGFETLNRFGNVVFLYNPHGTVSAH